MTDKTYHMSPDEFRRAGYQAIDWIADFMCFYVADRAVLIKTLSVRPEHLKNKASESGAVIDYRDWQVPLGRRFRALKLWFVIRHYGIQGLQHHVREHVRLAQEFRGWVEADKRFELATPAPLNLVTFRHVGADAVNQKILDAVNGSGKAYISHIAHRMLQLAGQQVEHLFAIIVDVSRIAAASLDDDSAQRQPFGVAEILAGQVRLPQSSTIFLPFASATV